MIVESSNVPKVFVLSAFRAENRFPLFLKALRHRRHNPDFQPNGTWQIAIPTESCIPEVNTNGDPVWEFNTVMSEKLNAYILNGMWLPEDYFDEFPSCREKSGT